LRKFELSLQWGVQVKIKAIGLLSAAAVLIWLAVGTMESSIEISSEPGHFNFYVNQGGLANIELRSRADEMRERLTYMVFKKERLETQNNLALTIQELITQHPFDANLWLELVYLQQQMGVSENERDWTFLVASSLSKWDSFRRLGLASHCISQSQIMSETWRSVCADLLGHLPKNQQFSTLLSVMKVDKLLLEKVLKNYGIENVVLRQN
jgi:hypothetical protein